MNGIYVGVKSNKLPSAFFTSPSFSRFVLIQDIVWVYFSVSDLKFNYIGPRIIKFPCRKSVISFIPENNIRSPACARAADISKRQSRPGHAIRCNRPVINFNGNFQYFFPLLIRLEICELQIRNDNQDTTHSFRKNRNL